MKISSFATAFGAAATIFLGTMTNVVNSQTATWYECDTSVSYEIEWPDLPTAEEIEFAIGALQTSYNAVHNVTETVIPDYKMEDTDVDTGAPASNPSNWANTPIGTAARRANRNTYNKDGSVNKKKKQHLRAGNDWYKQAVALLNHHSCRNCGGWDDDDSLGNEDVAAQILGSVTHSRWELAWCDELWQGPYDIFWDWIDTASCTITLTSCTQVPTPAPLLHVVDQVQEGGDVHATTEKKNLIAEPLRLAMNN